MYTSVTAYENENDVLERQESVSIAFYAIQLVFDTIASVLQGCYACGFYLEGARWSTEKNCLSRSLPKRLIEPLPVMSIIPIEAHRLLLQVSQKTKNKFCVASTIRIFFF